MHRIQKCNMSFEHDSSRELSESVISKQLPTSESEIFSSHISVCSEGIENCDLSNLIVQLQSLYSRIEDADQQNQCLRIEQAELREGLTEIKSNAQKTIQFLSENRGSTHHSQEPDQKTHKAGRQNFQSVDSGFSTLQNSRCFGQEKIFVKTHRRGLTNFSKNLQNEGGTKRCFQSCLNSPQKGEERPRSMIDRKVAVQIPQSKTKQLSSFGRKEKRSLLKQISVSNKSHKRWSSQIPQMPFKSLKSQKSLQFNIRQSEIPLTSDGDKQYQNSDQVVSKISDSQQKYQKFSFRCSGEIPKSIEEIWNQENLYKKTSDSGLSKSSTLKKQFFARKSYLNS